MRGMINVVLNDGDLEFSGDLAQPSFFVGGALMMDENDHGRTYVSILRDDVGGAGTGTLKQEDSGWRAELRVAPDAFVLLLQAWYSPVYYQLTMSFDTAAAEAGAHDLAAIELAMTRFEPEPLT
jgi:hypothetical protein